MGNFHQRQSPCQKSLFDLSLFHWLSDTHAGISPVRCVLGTAIRFGSQKTTPRSKKPNPDKKYRCDLWCSKHMAYSGKAS
jgi:hypothetical protein